ncbi:hypothetical protein As57867_003299, partial [Aphanomyces stellatus]
MSREIRAFDAMHLNTKEEEEEDALIKVEAVDSLGLSRREFNHARVHFKKEKEDEKGRSVRFEASAGSVQAKSSVERTAYMRNLTFRASASDIVQFCRDRGVDTIVRCEIHSDELLRSKGSASLTVTSNEAFETLLALDNALCYGRNVRVKEDTRPRHRRLVRDAHVHRWSGTSLTVGTLVRATEEFVPCWNSTAKIVMEFDGHGTRQLALEFGGLHRVEFKVRDVVRCCVHALDHGRACNLWLRLRRPPFCFRMDDDPLGLGFGGILKGLQSSHLWELTPQSSSEDSWVRTTDPSKDVGAFSHCLSYVTTLRVSVKTVLETLNSFGLRGPECHIPKRMGESPPFQLGAWSGGDDAIFAPLPWVIRYALHVLVARHKLDVMDGMFCTTLVKALLASPKNDGELSRGILALRMDTPERIATKLLRLATSPPLAVDAHVAHLSQTPLVRRVLVTPLRVVPEAPEPDQTNRVLRDYHAHLDRFVRVTFVDESFASIFSVQRSKDVFERLSTMIRDGLWIAGEKFEFLAYSGSQLRSQSCWFFKTPTADEVGHVPSIAEIRAAQGDFNGIDVAGKRAARLGQAFSSTIPAVEVPREKTRTIADVERNGFCFSDGVGYISEELATQVSMKMDLKWTASAFQIRYAGAKGMVSVRPPSMQYEVADMVLRRSMVKFPSEKTKLEICMAPSAMTFYLNRQIISVLSCLGVPDRAFLKLQDTMMATMSQCMSSREDAIALFEQHATAAPALCLLKAGATLCDQHVFEWVDALRHRLLLDIQLKARIYVPQGVCLVGVLDETHTLEAGTVFFQTRSSDYVLPPFGASVVVGRSPVLHPGDVRVLRRVDLEPLRHLYDVV